MTVESGAGADDDPNSKQNQPADSAGSKAESENPPRKVAKTIIEGAAQQLPSEPEGKKVAKTFLEIARPEASSEILESGSASQNDDSKQAIDQPRKVAKTMMEMPCPDVDNIEPASGDPELPGSFEPPRSVAKTKLEMSRPDVTKLASMIEGSHPQTSNLESAQPIPEEESSAPGRTVAKTMLEVSRPDLANVDSSNISTEAESTNAPAQGPPRKVARTMLELSLPAESATAKQVRKIAKTMMDVDSLDAIGMAKALNLPLKIAKSLSQPIIRRAAAVSNISDLDKTVKTEDYSGLDRTVKVEDSSELDRTVKVDIDPYRSERFVARTMLDHTVLSEALVRSAEKEKIRAGELAKERANEPVKEFHQVDSKKMATPCAWTWSESGGKDRVRSCAKCQTQVYDFTGMERPEAEALIFKQESRKKASLFKRADGKFMTKDCPVQVQRKRNLFLLCFFGVVIVISAIASMLLVPPQPKPPASTAAKTSDSVDAKKHETSKAPTRDANGAIHFEAGQPVRQFSPTSDSVLPQVDGKAGTTATTTTTTTNTSSEDEKYWDSPAK